MKTEELVNGRSVEVKVREALRDVIETPNFYVRWISPLPMALIYQGHQLAHLCVVEPAPILVPFELLPGSKVAACGRYRNLTLRVEGQLRDMLGDWNISLDCYYCDHPSHNRDASEDELECSLLSLVDLKRLEDQTIV